MSLRIVTSHPRISSSALAWVDLRAFQDRGTVTVIAFTDAIACAPPELGVAARCRCVS